MCRMRTIWPTASCSTQQTAFNLFGSSDVAGMEVTINGKTFPIAGVVKSEDDFATAAALDAGAEASSDPTASSRPPRP